MVLYADDTSIIVTNTNEMNFEINLKQTFNDINTWFNVNFLTLNFSKTQYLEFRSKNGGNIVTQIGYDQKIISNMTETKFLGLTIDDKLSWKQHIDIVINRLSSICYALRNIRYMVSRGTLRLIYFAHVQSIMNYGIIFWAGSSYAKKVFILQKRIIRIITNTKPTESCREVYKKLKIMPFYSLYIYSLLLYVINNKGVFNFNNDVHKYSTRAHGNLHVPIINTARFKKGAYISGIEIYNHLPQSIKNLANDEKSFKLALKRFLDQHSFYSIDEYFQYREDKGL